MSLFNMAGYELSSALNKKELTSSEITKTFLKRIEAVDDKIGAFLRICRDSALNEAAIVDQTPDRANEGTGIPVAVSDNICTQGISTTCASRVLKDFVPPYDATVVDRLKQAGLPILGKTNMDEFSMGSSVEHSGFILTKNPWDLSKVPGGSGGAAAAVAAGLAPWAVSSDTGGSIRQSAAFCGVVGLKPSYGLVSRFGLVAHASSLEQIGVIAQNVRDCRIMLKIICGPDPLDATTVNQWFADFGDRSDEPMTGLKIGVPKEYRVRGLDSQVQKAFRSALDRLKKAGVEVIEIPFPHWKYALACYYILSTAEASTNLARYDGVRYGYRQKADDVWTMFSMTRGQAFGPEVKRRLLLGTYFLSTSKYDSYYSQALKVRNLIRQEFMENFRQCDLIATPTTCSVAFGFNEKTSNPMDLYTQDTYTTPANLGGFPAISLPVGLSNENLPIGMQLIGPSLGEEKLLSAAGWVERLLGFKAKATGVEVKINE
jgi:aspartyl-tRNA(Asn)/glutamyl-tRNA(Gln) amidotransferase subunit A